MTSLPDSLIGLSRAEKLDLLDALWMNLECDTPAVLDAAEDDELDRRVATYEKNREAVTSWEELKAEVRG